MMPLHRHGLVPIDDAFDRGCALIKEVFGPNFYIEDESGRALTTLRNHRLLGYARDLMGNADRPALFPHREDVRRLGQLADIVTPEHHRQAAAHDLEIPFQHEVFDHAASAGALA